MRCDEDSASHAIRFAINLRTPDTIYCVAFVYLLTQAFKGDVRETSRFSDPPEIVGGLIEVVFPSEALYLRALLDCRTHLTAAGRVLANYRAALTRTDPRLRASGELLKSILRLSPVPPAGPTS